MIERHVEGVAVMTFGVEQPLLEELASRHVPMVFVDASPPDDLVRALIVDYQKGIQEGVQHLAVLGHRRFGFISGPLQQRSSQLRKAAFLESIDRIGIHPDPTWILEGDHTLEGGMQCMEQLLTHPELPTAVMCSNDMTAIGALRVLTRAGLRVPEDMSLIGFDDIHLAEFVNPPLTTVRMSRTDLARAAFGALRAIADGQEHPGHRRNWNVTTALTVRQSTGYPRGTTLGSQKNGAPEKSAKRKNAQTTR
jgi:LacI family transcriptional regulator